MEDNIYEDGDSITQQPTMDESRTLIVAVPETEAARNMEVTLLGRVDDHLSSIDDDSHAEGQSGDGTVAGMTQHSPDRGSVVEEPTKSNEDLSIRSMIRAIKTEKPEDDGPEKSDLETEETTEGKGLPRGSTAKKPSMPPVERRRSNRKRKSTPVYRVVATDDDPLDDLDDFSDIDVDVKPRPRRGRKAAIVAKKKLRYDMTHESDDDDYCPSEDEDDDEPLETLRQSSRTSRTRRMSTSRRGHPPSPPPEEISHKKKNSPLIGVGNMAKWDSLKTNLGISQDTTFSKKILDFLDDNFETLNQYCKPSKKSKKTDNDVTEEEEQEEERPSNPHGDDGDPFVCIQTNWEVKRWYLELASHAKGSTSGFLAHLLRLYCKWHDVELPQNSALHKFGMEFEKAPEGRVEDICECDRNKYTAAEKQIDTRNLQNIEASAARMTPSQNDAVNLTIGQNVSNSAGFMSGTNSQIVGAQGLNPSGRSLPEVPRNTDSNGHAGQLSSPNLTNSSEVIQNEASGPASQSVSGRNEVQNGPSSIPNENTSDVEADVNEKTEEGNRKKKKKGKKLKNLKKKELHHPSDISTKDYFIHEIPGENGSKKKYYECAWCHKIYKSWIIFCHIRVHKGKKHSCTRCGKQSVLLNPKIPQKRSKKPTKCAHCSFSCMLRSAMKEHIAKEHPDEYAASERFLCEQCGKELKTKGSLKDHRRTHMPQVRSFVCDSCGKAFTTRRFLRIHMNGVHGNRKFECSHEGCDKHFNTKNMLRTHVNRVHLRIKKVSCPYETCLRNFFSRSELQQHMRVYHTKEKLFSCKWEGCGKAFRTPYHVQVHMRIHTDEKPLKCPHCDYRARQRNALNWHLKKHDANPERSAHVPKPRVPRPPKVKPMVPMPRHEVYPEPPQHSRPMPYQPQPPPLPSQYEYSGVPPNPFTTIQVDNQSYTLPYPAQSVFPPGGMQYQSL